MTGTQGARCAPAEPSRPAAHGLAAAACEQVGACAANTGYRLIIVERQPQKGIEIGAKGARLKVVGTTAREELERQFGRKVFLQLWVKVREDWRDKTAILRELGAYRG
jgi:GTP-binding protein Era